MSRNPAWIPLYWTLTKCYVYSKVSQVGTGSSITSSFNLKNMDLTVQFPKPPRNTGFYIPLYLPNLAKMFVAKNQEAMGYYKVQLSNRKESHLFSCMLPRGTLFIRLQLLLSIC